MGLISSGVTGINAATYGLLTTEHNIANASTPGYNRQRIVQSTVNPLFTGSGFIGQGTQVSTVERSYNQFLTRQVSQSQSAASELQAYSSQIAQIDNLLADPNAGLTPALQEFFRGVQQVTADPASIPARQALSSSAETLVGRFKSIDSRLLDLANGVNSQISGAVDVVNSYAQQIAEINQRIVLAQASANQPANDLLDQRDFLVSELNKMVRVTTIEQRDSSYSVFIGTGQQLVVGPQVNKLDARPSITDGDRMSVGYVVGNAYQELPEFVIAGGELGGLLRFRNESLDAAFNGIGQIAASLALTFNAQHALGQDLLGNVTGGADFVADFFTSSGPKTIASTANTGNGVVDTAFLQPVPYNGNFYTKLTTSDYQLTRTGANYTVTRLSDQKQWTDTAIGSLSLTVAASEGFQFSLTSGAIASGDSFLIRPTREIARNIGVNAAIAVDPRKIAAATPLRTQALPTNTGEGRISAGEVSGGYVPLAGNIDMTYDAGAGALFNFPAGVVMVTTPAGVSTSYPVAGPATRVPFTAGAKISFGGNLANSVVIEGTPADNDVFRVGPNTGGVSDGRNMLRLGALQTQNTALDQTTTFQGAYAQLVSKNGNRAREVGVTLQAQETLLAQASAAREAESGVNLDEEAANLIRYQQAYQAAARVIDTASRLFDELLALGR